MLAKENTGDVIKLSSIRKNFDEKSVLDKIDLGVSSGCSVCLCGPNGAGKSTLLRIMSGLLEPDDGTVELCGLPVDKHPEETMSQLGMVMHKGMLYPDLTVLENLLFFAGLYGIKDKSSRVENLIKDVGLDKYKHDRADILSRGLLQRLAIARALVHKPTVLLVDEPFTGLDSEAAKHLVRIFNDFTANNGTIVMTTHDIKIGLACCSRVVVLDKAKLIFDAMKKEINTDDFAADYLSYAGREN